MAYGSGAEVTIRIAYSREEDGRWIAEVPSMPGALAYGTTRDEARRRVQAIALRVLADQLDTGMRPTLQRVRFGP